MNQWCVIQSAPAGVPTRRAPAPPLFLESQTNATTVLGRSSLGLLPFIAVFLGLLATAVSIRAASLSPEPATDLSAVPIGSRREPLIDTFLVQELKGSAQRRMHAPLPQEIALQLDQPWEGIYSAYFTVFQDEDRYRMYYRGMPEAKHDFANEVTCYAESPDGIRWSKPDLTFFTVRGHATNNVILARHRACHNFAPFKDTRPGCPPDQRYKALGGTGAPGLIALVSPDGLHWSELQQEPVVTEGAFDSQNVSYWSESEAQYVGYFRVFRQSVRWIARTTSSDFRHWTAPVDLAFGDQPIQHLYTSQLTPYPRAPHIYLGLPTRFLPGRKALTDEQTQSLGTSTRFDFRGDCADILLVSTRAGGSQLDRAFMDAYIRPGPDPRNWTSRANYAARGILQTGDAEWSIYVNHNVGYPSTHIRRYTLRPDGFASINATFGGGQMITKPIEFTGRSLSLNYATSAAGSVRVELINTRTKEPVPGFALDQCEEIFGDDLARTVRWTGGASLADWSGRPVQLRFVLADADLFSFQFVP